MSRPQSDGIMMMQRRPSSDTEHWNLALAWDEFIPGNKLSVVHPRKVLGIHLTFVELGQRAMSNNIAWIPVAVLRSQVVETLEGGMPQALRSLLVNVLFGTSGLCTTGIPVCIRGKHVLLYASPTNLVSDGDGLRAGLGWRGASSIKPCIIHKNVLKKASATDTHD